MRAILFLALTGALVAAPQPPALRLPADAVPTHYQLELMLDPAKDDFSGIVRIDLKVAKATDLLWLNASSLQISAATLMQGTLKSVAQIVPGGEDFTGFQFDHKLSVGPARLRVEYTGKVNLLASAGIFLSKRNDDRYLFTQFEAIDARRAFPCYDEPGYKVPWQVSLDIPAGQNAVSNTPVERETTTGATKRITFRETKPLPSYLIAFGVGPLEFVDAGTACRNKVPVRIVVPRGDAPRAKYAASVTAEILTRLEEYFDIPYPYEKADQLAIPVSFGGAMENPGLVTYDAEIVLAPPQGDDPLQRQREYALVAAHELSHQWFGDLVTMAWWNDTWLNESFATMMEQKLISTWKPEWQSKVDDQGSRTYAMWLDRLETARRIDQPIESKSDIGSAFDGITYEKGGSVLQMFDHSMGAEKFRQAARFYLKNHAWGNGTSQDFIDALSEMAGAKVGASFRTFLQQAGVPEVQMTLKCEGGTAQVEMQQQRFLPLGSTAKEDQLWKIPVCVAYEDGGKRATQCSELDGKSGSIALKAHGCPAWLLGNADEVGYYYSNYSGAALSKLVENRSKLSLAEQVGLFSEMSNSTRAGRMPLSEALRLSVQLKDEANRHIMESSIELARVRVTFLPENLRPKYAKYVRDNFGARARALGWIPKPGESEDDGMLRPGLVGFVAREGKDPELIASATKLAGEWLDSRKPLPSVTINEIFSCAGRNGDAALYYRILTAAKAEKDELYQRALIGALGSFPQAELVQRNLQTVLDGAFDLRIAGFPLLFGALNDPATEQLPLQMIMAHYDEIVAKLPTAAGSDYAGFLPQAAAQKCSAADAKEVQAFFGPRMEKVNGGPRNLAQVVESIKLCEERKKVQQPDLIQFFTGL